MITMGEIRPIPFLLTLAVVKILLPSRSELAGLVLRRIRLVVKGSCFCFFLK